VDTGHGEAMLPLHEDLLLKVDKRSKTLIMKIPEGLI
jgi:ribosomal 30S subunit maturation factor RimM